MASASTYDPVHTTPYHADGTAALRSSAALLWDRRLQPPAPNPDAPMDDRSTRRGNGRDCSLRRTAISPTARTRRSCARAGGPAPPRDHAHAETGMASSLSRRVQSLRRMRPLRRLQYDRYDVPVRVLHQTVCHIACRPLVRIANQTNTSRTLRGRNGTTVRLRARRDGAALCVT